MERNQETVKSGVLLFTHVVTSRCERWVVWSCPVCDIGGPLTLNSTWRHGHFLTLTCDIGLLILSDRRINVNDMTQGMALDQKNSDRGHCHFLKSTGDIGGPVKGIYLNSTCDMVHL